MKRLVTVFLTLLLFSTVVQADLNEGDLVPDPTLKTEDGKEVKLHELLDKITVIHLWKCQ
ncbi:MAG TPA: hypothetical protein ENL08_05455 [Bacteroidetes bacterium]|nr:hypothetical protein [Bacteroidota bacterium]